ncbi:hypothetical protein GCM10007424_14480 [Flavobacterium suaedae]|uniref:T9SS type A sorting domain-containing protein n=1 Tax=Flavobacterium suaedae TaxID=1767027 RepID=A0ABQ1JW50_9FLAO|nr:GEVED domain-containing protein [Flavobacterium suaedae]GGB75649.1 hypothetical protein GCM10007424_14480 [Flavobacterium suaedae]
MKKNLHSLLCCFVIFFAFTTKGISQINYSESFDDADHGWGLYLFGETDVAPCEGDGALRTNIYYSVDYANILSPSLGTSAGETLTLSFDYKVVEYTSDTPTDPTLNENNWGYIGIYYAPTAEGPFTQIGLIDTENHTESSSCATWTVDFAPTAGEEIYIGIEPQLGDLSGDFFVYLDEVSLTEAPECNGTPDASDTVSSTDVSCNTEEVVLSLSTLYLNAVEYQWQTSSNGVDFTDVAEGGNTNTYSVIQEEDTWYQAIITCTNGGESVTSTPILVTSTGMPCYCDIEFDSVEPITSVNFAGIDNQSSAEIDGSPGVENFTDLTPAEVLRGGTYTLTLEGNTAGEYETPFMLYIDFNQNGVFDDEGEAFEAGSVENSDGEDGQQAVTEIQIPVTAMEGVTQMRILKLFDEYSTDPCSSDDGIGYGQAEDYLINITACTTEAPTAAAEQNFCLEASIQELAADSEEGDTIQWYETETGGEPIEGSAMLTDDTVYYASITPEGGCESEVRTAVTVYIHTVETPTVQLLQPTCAEPTGTIEITAPLGTEYEYSIDGENFQVSPVFEGVTAGTYQVYASVDGCESVAVEANIDEAPEAPEVATVTVIQPACNNPYGSIEVTAPVGAEYEYSIDGVNYQESAMFADLLPGTYEVTVNNVDGCTSTTSGITINEVPVIDAPTADANQDFCNNAMVEDLDADGSGLVWYDAETEGNMLAEETVLVDGTTYYVAATDGDCESTRVAVTVAINIVAAPTGETTQEFEQVISVSDIEITATGEVTWYATEEDAVNGENDLDPSTVIDESGTYYATQTIDDCESEPFAVTVSIVLNADGFDKTNFTYHPNPVKDVLTLSYQNTIDAVQVYSLLGQKVIEQSGNQNEVKLDMSQLAAGNYIVKVVSGATTTTIKVVKE